MNIKKIMMNDDNILKLISVFLAVILFLTVNNFGSPFWGNIFKTTEYINDVPLNVVYDPEKYVMSGLPETIDVKVTGQENEVQNVLSKEDELVAEISLEQYTTAGEYIIDDSLIDFNITTSATIEPVEESYSVVLQDNIAKNFAIDTTYINGEENEGVMLSVPELSQYDVTVYGGSQDVEEIVTVMGLIDLNQLDTSSNNYEQQIEVPLVAYDENGGVVNGVTISPPTITVSQVFEMSSVEIPVQYEFINNDTGMYVSEVCDVEVELCDKTTTPTVRVYGSQEQISDMNVVTYTIDLSTLEGDSGVVTGLPVLKPEVYIMGEAEKEYNVKLEKGETVVIEDVPIQSYGLDPNLTATASSKEDTQINVEVTGAQSVVADLTKDDIVLSVNLENITSPGTYGVPIQVQRESNFEYELEQEEIVLEVTEKE